MWLNSINICIVSPPHSRVAYALLRHPGYLPLTSITSDYVDILDQYDVLQNFQTVHMPLDYNMTETMTLRDDRGCTVAHPV